MFHIVRKAVTAGKAVPSANSIARLVRSSLLGGSSTIREFGTRRITIPSDVAKVINTRCATTMSASERAKLLAQVSRMWRESSNDHDVAEFTWLKDHFTSSDTSAVIIEGLSANGKTPVARNISLLISEMLGGEIEVNLGEDSVDVVAQDSKTLPPHFDFGCNLLALYGVKGGEGDNAVKTYLLDPQKIFDALTPRERQIAMSPMFVYEEENPHPLFWYVEDILGIPNMRAIIDSGINNFKKMRFFEANGFTKDEARGVMEKIITLAHEFFKKGEVENFNIRTDDLVIINNEAVLHGRGENLQEYFDHIDMLKTDSDFMPQNAMLGRIISRSMTVVGNSWKGPEWLTRTKALSAAKGDVEVAGAIVAVVNGVTSPVLVGEDGEYYSASLSIDDKKNTPLDKRGVILLPINS